MSIGVSFAVSHWLKDVVLVRTEMDSTGVSNLFICVEQGQMFMMGDRVRGVLLRLLLWAKNLRHLIETLVKTTLDELLFLSFAYQNVLMLVCWVETIFGTWKELALSLRFIMGIHLSVRVFNTEKSDCSISLAAYLISCLNSLIAHIQTGQSQRLLLVYWRWLLSFLLFWTHRWMLRLLGLSQMLVLVYGWLAEGATSILGRHSSFFRCALNRAHRSVMLITATHLFDKRRLGLF